MSGGQLTRRNRSKKQYENLSEEDKQKKRETALKWYYKHRK